MEINEKNCVLKDYVIDKFKRISGIFKGIWRKKRRRRKLVEDERRRVGRGKESVIDGWMG